MIHKPKRSTVSYHSSFVVLSLIVIMLSQIACGCGGLDLGLLSELSTVKETVSGDWINVYFTSPRYPDDAADHYGGLDEELAAIEDILTD